MTTGEKIAAQRRMAGLSQAALAEKLYVSRQAVSRWETNESLPDADKIVQLSQVLHVSTDYLLLDGRTAPGSAAPSAAPWRRWFSYLCLGLAAAGALLALTGLAASAAWAVTTDTWYTDYGRFGTALFFHWPGPVLLSGLILLVLAVLLLAFDVLFAKQQSNSQSSIEREQTP